MVTMDAIHALAHELTREGMRVLTLPESFLTLEGVVRAIDKNPPRFGNFLPEAEAAKGFFQAFMSRGFLPLVTIRLENGQNHYLFAICANDMEAAGRPLRNIAEITIKYEEARQLSDFPFNWDSGCVDFILIPGEEPNQYGELVTSGVIFEANKREFFLHGIDPDSTARDSFYAMLKFAISRRASDIHIEPDPNLSDAGEGLLVEPVSAVMLPEKNDDVDINNELKAGGRIRYRIDGVLVTGQHILTRMNIRKIVAVIKNLAAMQMDEHRLPQDGRISFGEEEVRKFPFLSQYDLRVSVLPTVHGEKAQLRILHKQASSIKLADCGFSPAVLDRLRRKIREPRGIILVTGPTGSGKTTTLYAMLNEINDGQANIVTVEDPVESIQPGITQVQVDKRIDLDFARILRSLMRQDPDIIFVGEIRDEETAKTAVRAAITGHLVFSTIHVDSSLDTILRLEGLGVPGVYIASSLEAVIAQRLVRKLCPYCLETYNGREELKCLWGKDLFDNDITLKRAVIGRSCNNCDGTGYTGRLLLAELYMPTMADRELITAGRVDYAAYFREAIKHGFEPMTYVAIKAVLAGQTDIAEIMRAAATEDDFRRDGQLIAPIIQANLKRLRQM